VTGTTGSPVRAGLKLFTQEATPGEWSYVSAWMVPGLLLRSALTFALLFVLTHFAAAAGCGSQSQRPSLNTALTCSGATRSSRPGSA
jgi:hypothetical protein